MIGKSLLVGLALVAIVCFCGVPSTAHAGVFADYFATIEASHSSGGAFNVADTGALPATVAPASTGIVNPAILPRPGAVSTAQALATTQATCAATGGVGCSPGGAPAANGGMGGGNNARRARRNN